PARTHSTMPTYMIPPMDMNENVRGTVIAPPHHSTQAPTETPIIVSATNHGAAFQRLSPLPPTAAHVPAPEPKVSEIQREREEMLAIYESPSNLQVPLFGKLAGKSKDQINRELKAGKLLSISLGNRGQRIPDWQLVPLKQKLAQVLLNQSPGTDSWTL